MGQAAKDQLSFRDLVSYSVGVFDSMCVAKSKCSSQFTPGREFAGGDCLPHRHICGHGNVASVSNSDSSLPELFSILFTRTSSSRGLGSFSLVWICFTKRKREPQSRPGHRACKCSIVSDLSFGELYDPRKVKFISELNRSIATRITSETKCSLEEKEKLEIHKVQSRTRYGEVRGSLRHLIFRTRI